MLERYIEKKYRILREKIQAYKYVSFDLYDTLINRYVNHPKDVFDIVETAYIKKYKKIGIENFSKLRIETEKKLRINCENEITLNEIYENISSFYSQDIIKRYRELEIKIELEISYLNDEMIEVFNECIAQGKVVYITTDMYLPIDIIEELLKRHGISGYKKIYLSCNEKKSKKNGEIFEYILKKEKICSNDIVHIGDNFVSDYLKPRKEGIKSYYFNGKSLRRKEESVEAIVVDNFIYNLNKKEFADTVTSIGISVLGPLVYGYVMWLKIIFEKEKFSNILFFSREGKFIKKAYDMINDEKNNQGIYFLASRRALQLAAICICPEYEEVMKSMFLPREFTTEWLINGWGLTWDEYGAELEMLGLKRDGILSKFQIMEDKCVKAVYERFKEHILEKSREECEAFISYVRSNNIMGRIAIVDIGWNGNMQKAFEKIINAYVPEVDSVTGFYYGVFTSTKNHEIQKMNSYISIDNNMADYIKNVYAHTSLELLFMANHGTFLSYSNMQKKGRNLGFSEFEYRGTLTEDCVNKIQLGALLFIKEFCDLGEFLNYSDENGKRFLRKFEYPDMDFAKIIGDLEIIDKGVVRIAKPSKFKNYLLNPMSLYKEFLECSWKIGFCKRLFRVSINYGKIINFLEKRVVNILRKS